jgi:hypothetical protein
MRSFKFLLFAFFAFFCFNFKAHACSVTVNPADDYSTIQSYINSAKQGEVICFSAGEWTLPSSLTINSKNITLAGAGAYATYLKFSNPQGPIDGIVIQLKKNLINKVTKGNMGVEIRDLTIDTDGIGINFRQDQRLEGLIVNKVHVLSLDMGVAAVRLKRGRITDSQFLKKLVKSKGQTNWRGIYLEDSRDVKIIGNTMNGSGFKAGGRGLFGIILCNGTNGTVISNNSIGYVLAPVFISTVSIDNPTYNNIITGNVGLAVEGPVADWANGKNIIDLNSFKSDPGEDETE